MFSIGLASHTLKFDIHYKNQVVNAFIFLVLLATILTGVLATLLSNFKVLEVNPNSLLQRWPRIDLPSVSHSTEFNESEWYSLV